LDREAAKQAFAVFLSSKKLSADQIEFIDMIINRLTDHGVVKPDLLYESPFTDITPQGPDGIFAPAEVHSIITLLNQIKDRAVA
jgi:type I restriction enzyme, R subunit